MADNDPRAAKTVAELRAEAKARGLHGYSTMKKAELLAALAADTPATDTPDAPTPAPADPDAPAGTATESTVTEVAAVPAKSAELPPTAVQTSSPAADPATRTDAAPAPVVKPAVPAVDRTPEPARLKGDAVAQADAARDQFSRLRRTAPTPLSGQGITPAMIAALIALLAAVVVILRRRRR